MPVTAAHSTQGPSTRGRAGRVRVVAAIAAAAVLALGACSGSAERSDSAGSGAAGRGAPAAPARAADTAAGGEAGGKAVTATATADPPADRQRVVTADVELRVRDLPTARRRAEAAVAAAGGFLAKEDLDNSTGAATRSTATYRVPPDRFRPALAELITLGKVGAEHTATDDVSATVADVDSRVATLHASSDRLRGFLSQATDPNQIASLEGELTRREAEASSLEAQQRSLADQVAYATIVATFTADGATPPVQQARPAGFARGLDVGVTAATAIGRSLLALAGFTLPFLPVLLGAALLWRWARRRTPGGRRVAPGAGGVS